MASVTATTGWVFTADAVPSGTLTIDSGSNRKLVIFMARENNTDPAPTTMTVGGVAATESFSFQYEPVATPDQWLYAWVWNESAIGSMSGSAASYAGTASSFGRFWGYGTVENTNQANLTAFTGTNGSTTGPLSVTSTSSAGDLITALAIADSNVTTFTGWDTLTEVFDADIDGARGGFAAGNGGDATTSITISVSDQCSVAVLAFPNAAATKYLKLLTHPSAASATGVEVVVYSAPSGSDYITGTTRYGSAASKSFNATTEGEQAVLKIPAADVGCSGLAADTVVAAQARNATYTTGTVEATIIEE